jgi:hypothetical protein
VDSGTILRTLTIHFNFLTRNLGLTGIVDLVASAPGKFTVTYTITSCSGGCGPTDYSTNTVIIINPNAWTGGVSTDWNTQGNWVANGAPTTCPDFTILSSATYQPTLSAGIFAIRNIVINYSYLEL